jgi:FtsZ-interacting cell division protein ZipA
MPELRWTLLVLGVLFIAALAWWELRKPRQAQRGQTQRSPGLSPTELNIDPAARVYREPTINLPPVNVPEVRPREPVQGLPVIEVPDDDSLIGLRLDGERAPEEAGEPDTVSDESVLPSEREPEPEPSREMPWETGREIMWNEDPSYTGTEPAVSDAPPVIPTEPESEPRAEVRISPLDMPQMVEPVVDWPEESQRQIIALRLVSPGERFPGRAVRQALASEGFMLGKYSIYHKAGMDGRAVVSAASLTRPGTFDPDSIDTQRFGGLYLFAVLPGPLSANEAFDELLSSARNLNERLRGGLQDEKGQPLTPTLVGAIRASLPQSAEPTA